MSTLTVAPVWRQQYLDADGHPLAFGFIKVYEAGTAVHAVTYNDATGVSPQAWPLVLDAAGRATIFLLPGSYHFYVENSASVPQWDEDLIMSVAPFNVDLDITGTAGETLPAGTVVYLSDGSGAKTAGQWFKTDADFTYASSAAGMVGMVPGDIANGVAGSIRLAGRLTGLAGLTIGAPYYASTVAGGLTTVAPTNTRFLGVADSATTIVIAPNPFFQSAAVDVRIAALVTPDNRVNDFRLTLTSGTPVTTADVLAAVNVYASPYGGNRIALYDGALWNIRTSAEFSIALPAAASQVYDVFCYDNAGVPTLELLAWTNDTTRATALVQQNGVLCKTGALTRRYLGTVRTTAVAGQTEDSVTKRYLWNYYHRTERALELFEATGSWAYNVNTIRQARASGANQVDIVIGVSEDPVVLDVVATVSQVTGTNNAAVGVGLDSTTTFAANQSVQVASMQAGVNGVLRSQYRGLPGIGRHVLSWNEVAFTTVTTTFWGTSAAVAGIALAASCKSGLLGYVKG